MITTPEPIRLSISRMGIESKLAIDARDPRLHLFLAFGGSILLLFNQQLFFQFGSFFFLLTLLIWWRMSLVTILKSLWPVLIMMSLTVVYHLLFGQVDGDDYGARPILYSPKLDRGLFYAFRLGTLFLLIVQIAKLVKSDRLADSFLSILKALRPLQRIGIPIAQTSLAVRAGLSSIPGISHAMRELEQSQQIFHHSNGSQEKSVSRRIRRFSRLLVPMLVTVIRRADHLTLALRARGYQPATQMSLQTDLRWRTRDTVECAAIIAIFTALLQMTA